MGFPEGWVCDHVKRRDALRLLGNAVVPQQAALALGLLLGIGTMPEDQECGKLLPTPAAGVFNDSEDPVSWLKRAQRMKEKHNNGNGAGMLLPIAVKLEYGKL